MSGLVTVDGVRGYPCGYPGGMDSCKWCGLDWDDEPPLCGVRNAQAAEDLRDTIGDICGGQALTAASVLYQELDEENLAAARREYARLGELLRELEGS